MPPFPPAATRDSTLGRIRHRMRVLCAELRRGLVRMLAVALGTALLAGAMGALLPTAGAQAAARTAAVRTLSGGRSDQAIKASYQSAVTGPVAHGGGTPADAAATVGESRFGFDSASGGYDPASGALYAGDATTGDERAATGTTAPTGALLLCAAALLAAGSAAVYATRRRTSR
ncbi:HtaA domain-containing protein [Streptomyces sp. NPDC059008]|uniref:HtaA domain-containing protein n=1 Tax=Streptomyces sp. NPDC059008 TaxID=3346693 RepID=UPI00369EFEA2